MSEGRITNVRHIKFCENLAKLGSEDIDSQGKAYMEAGYKCKNLEVASAAASRLLNDVSIRAYYEELIEAVKSDAIASVTEVQEFFTKAMRGELKEEVAMVIPGEFACIETRKIEISPKDRVKAAENMAKIQQQYVIRHSHEGNVAVTFVDDLEDPGDEDADSSEG